MKGRGCSGSNTRINDVVRAHVCVSRVHARVRDVGGGGGGGVMEKGEGEERQVRVV